MRLREQVRLEEFLYLIVFSPTNSYSSSLWIIYTVFETYCVKKNIKIVIVDFQWQKLTAAVLVLASNSGIGQVIQCSLMAIAHHPVYSKAKIGP